MFKRTLQVGENKGFIAVTINEVSEGGYGGRPKVCAVRVMDQGAAKFDHSGGPLPLDNPCQTLLLLVGDGGHSRRLGWFLDFNGQEGISKLDICVPLTILAG
jgi:hypothetical protein